ncbi:unnamed protein product [Ceratitis capitata]|uniref:(Mediterranean fruit fly) hypothetical protein n=1 Tax=Ceratitis capitata TaxID=7213 RepID=A0A811VCL1_CERCA|nr:unnamed protein product [Ceratitis capitata]
MGVVGAVGISSKYLMEATHVSSWCGERALQSVVEYKERTFLEYMYIFDKRANLSEDVDRTRAPTLASRMLEHNANHPHIAAVIIKTSDFYGIGPYDLPEDSPYNELLKEGILPPVIRMVYGEL